MGQRKGLVRAESLESLAAYPVSRMDLERWRQWAIRQVFRRKVPDAPQAFDAMDMASQNRCILGWRALITQWVDRGFTVAPDDAPLVMYYFLVKAPKAPPFVRTAARRLMKLQMTLGATSTDVLFLCAAFCWPLRWDEQAAGEDAWNYVIHAPWQTDMLSLKDMLLAVQEHGEWRAERGLLELVDQRFEHGHFSGAKRLMEATALIQARAPSLLSIKSYRDFSPLPVIRQANEVIVKLARLYKEEEQDQVWAREVIRRAAELTRSKSLVRYVEQMVWDLPLEETYAWSGQLVYAGQLDAMVERALGHNQPHHARRLAEAVMLRAYGRTWRGSLLENLPLALGRFEADLLREPPANPVVRRAAEHLGVLYVRTHHMTSYARRFVYALAGSVAFTGKGATLHAQREELEYFYNQTDPYQVMRRDSERLGQVARALSSDEQEATEAVERWFGDHFRMENPSVFDRLAQVVATPVSKVSTYLGHNAPVIEQSCVMALDHLVGAGVKIAGNLERINKEGALIRSRHGHGLQLMEYARGVASPDVWMATSAACVTSLPSASLGLVSHAADLSTSLLLAARAVTKIGAAYGRFHGGEDDLRFIANALMVGLSSNQGEGLLVYASDPMEHQNGVLESLTVGGVMYGGSRLVEYLWLAPRASGKRPSERFVTAVGRMCGFEISQTAVAKVVPVVGAVLSGMSTYSFMKRITEAALHICARDALIMRAQSLEEL